MKMKTATIWIVEDNMSFALEMEILLEKIGHTVLGISAKGEDALSAIISSQPELVIMDINLGGEMTGLDLAEKLEDEPIPILFITVHDRPEYLQRAERTNWAGFLVKPFDKLSLQAAIDLALRNWKNKGKAGLDADIKEDSLLIKAKGVFHKVAFKDILYIQSEGNYCTIFSTDRKYALKTSLRHLLGRLPKGFFAQTHKSYAVQLGMISAIDTVLNEVAVGPHRIPLGKGFRDELVTMFRVLK